MKYFTLFFIFFATLSISTSSSAQFKLKKLENVVVSMSQGESIDNYSSYLTGYFGRIELTESLMSKGNYILITLEGKQFLQGEGINDKEQKVVFRIEVFTSADGLTITKAPSEYIAQACISIGCSSCVFKDDSSCFCEGEGECNHSISRESK
jgi:hypothetical protein